MHTLALASRSLSLPFALTLAVLTFVSPVLAAPPDMVPGEVLIRFKAEASASDVRAIMDDLGATRIKRFGRIRAEQDRITRYAAQEAVDKYKHHRAVDFIEPNYIVQMDNTPNDPRFNEQWGLLNTGQTGGTPGADIRATQAWDLQTGSSDVIVAIIDSGSDYTHPDLAANIWTNPGEIPGNGIDDDGNGFVDDVHGYDFYNNDGDPMDDNGHGTHTAGTVGAIGNNGIGVSGVAWHVKLMLLKHLGSGGSGPISAAVQCIEYATQMGADIMSNSWGTTGFSEALQAAVQDANAAGILFVAAAGNSSASLDTSPHYPASFNVPNVIAVASTTDSDALSGFSNFGAHTVHLAAPGSNILSTVPGGAYQVLSGTSMATPHVSGALALLKSQYPSMSAPAMKAVLLTSVDPIPSLSGLLISGGRLNAVRMLEGLDSTLPAPIADVSVAMVFSDRVVLHWTATGDDGDQGTASAYDVRYDVGPIDEDSFEYAMPATSVPPPAPAGVPEEITVSGLAFHTTYYFAVKAIDEYGNASPISNVVSATTLGVPDLAFTPPSLSQSLQTGESATQTLTVQNVGEGSLDFTAEPFAPEEGAAMASMALAKGEPDPRVGNAVIQSSGGPDVFGHLWIDSDQAGGPAYSWEEISASGVALPISGDDVTSSAIPLGFSFPFYDNMFNQIRVCTNGFLSFTSSSSDYVNQPLPSVSAPENLVAPFWDDLIYASGSAIYVEGDGTKFVVEWRNLYHYGGGGPYTFEAILRPDGSITYQYFSMQFPVDGETVGIQNGARNDGLTIAFNTPYVHAGLAVRIVAVPNWLSISPAEGTVLAGQSTGLSVRFDAKGVDGGDYDAAVRIASNDPDEAAVSVPVHLHVDPAPDIAVDYPSLDFLSVFIGSTETITLGVHNEGVSPLAISSITASPTDYGVDDVPVTLPPGGTAPIDVRFSPSRTGAIPGELRIESDDPDEGVLTVSLAGVGLVPPDITVSPASLESSLLVGATETQSLTISNAGGSDLVVDLAARQMPVPEVLGSNPVAVEGGPSSASSDDAAASAQAGALDSTRPVLVIQETAAWGIVMSDFLQARFGITPTVISSSQIATTDFDAYDLVITVGDESNVYYGNVSANAAKFEAYVSQGGVVQYQLATHGENVLLPGGAVLRYGDLELQNRVLLPDHPIVANLPDVLEGYYANHAYLTDLPAGAKVITESALERLPTTVEYRIGSGTVIATGMTWEHLYYYGYNAAPMLPQSTQYALSLAVPPWLSVSPPTASIPPGGTLVAQATFDATRRSGGGYDGEIQVASNDPDQGEIQVAARLTVIDAADVAVSPTAIDFGSVFLTAFRDSALLVRNEGTLPLQVSDIEMSDPDFTVDAAAFDLAPHESRQVVVRYAPTRTGPVHATATLQSDDPDEPSVVVPLDGTALEAPDIDATPRSFSQTLASGQTGAQTLVIQNLGGSDLTFQIGLEDSSDGAASASPGADSGTGPAPAAERPWSGYPEAADDSIGPMPGLPEAVPLPLPVVIHDASSDGGAVDLVAVRAGARSGVLWIEMEMQTVIDPNDFAGFLSLDVDQNRQTGVTPSFGSPFQDIGAEYEFEFFSLGSGVVALVDHVQSILIGYLPVQIEDHILRFATPLSLLGNDDGRMDVTGVIGTAYGPTDWFPNLGHGTIGGADWLSASPDHGTVPPGAAMEVTLAFDAGSLDAGGYDAHVIVDNNDPDEGHILLPARMDVTGAPVVSVQPASLDFGSVFVGASKGADFKIFNVGTDELVVSDIAAVDASYAADTTSFQVDPRTSRIVHVAFTPASEGDHATTLEISYNGDGSPAALALSGAGLPPPVATLSPASLHADLLTGDQESQTLTLGNAGGSDLTFRVVLHDAVASEAAAPPEVPDSLKGPTLNSTRPDSGPASVQAVYSGPYLMFGITSYGEIMPFQSPTGYEHLQVGTYLSGYTLAYGIGGVDHVAYAAQYARNGLTPVSYEELENSAANVVVRVISRTSDGALEIHRVFTFPRGDKYVRVETEIENLSAGPVSDVVYKEVADWDVDGDYPDDTWNYDRSRNMVYAWDQHYVGLASNREPAFMDLYGWDDYESRGTYVDFPSGPVGPLDGLAVLHFSLGALGASERASVAMAYGAGNDAEELRQIMDRAVPAVTWLSVAPESGVVPAGGTLDLAAAFDPGTLRTGDYTAEITIDSNDPVTPALTVPASLHVTGVPRLTVSPASLDFGTVFLGQHSTLGLLVTNAGTETLEATTITAGSPDFTASPSSLSLAPGAQGSVTLVFAPTVEGDRSTTVSIASNDPYSPKIVPVTAAGLEPPIITLSPTSLHSNLESGDLETQSLTVGNAGGSPLTFSIGAQAAAAEVPVLEATDVPRGTVDPREGDAVTTGSGGPDRYGYRWIDSDQAGGPVFDWVEIRDVGTRISMREQDSNSGPLPIGFAFPFYGNVFSEFDVCTHGWVSFTSPAVAYSNQPLPTAGAPENLLAAFWDDLDFSGAEHAYYHNDGTRLVIEYSGVPGTTAGSGPYTFEILLYPSGAIVYQYLAMNGGTASATIGIQNEAKDDGLLVAFNTSYLHDGLAVRITSAPAWLTAYPTAGVADPNAGVPIAVTMNAAGLFPGDYAGLLRVTSNDPVFPSRDVPASLHVIGIPHLATSPAELVFDTLFVGQSAARVLRLTNVGTDRLDVTAFASGYPDFSVSPPTVSLAALQSTTVSVSFAAGTPGNRSADLVISSNAPESPARVPMRAVTLVPPVMELDPGSMVAAAPPGGAKEKSLRVRNTGGSDLRWGTQPPVAPDGSSEAADTAFATAAKDSVDSRTGILGSGGPDLFGHRWVDSDEPGGPVFDWVDIAAIGTRIPFSANADDENLGPFPIGFDFPFYDGVFSEFRVCTNGWMSFTSSSTRYFNEPLPSHGGDIPVNLLAVAWDDMVFFASLGSAAYYYSDGSRLIVQWDNLRTLGPASPTMFSFQAILSPNGTITYQYLSVSSTPYYATVGIQNGAGSDGMTVEFNTAYLHPELAVQITAPVRWVSITPRSGVVGPGGYADVQVRFDAGALAAGDYEADLKFFSNQPDPPSLTSHFLLHVGSVAAADVSVDPNTLNLASNGNKITAYVELPAGYDPGLVVPETVRLLGSIAADGDALVIGDFNHNQLPDLQFKFDRAAVEAILPEGDGVPVDVTGEIRDTIWFTALETLRVIRPHVTAPDGGESLPAGSLVSVTWDDPQGWHVDHADLIYSFDGGTTWSLLAEGVVGNVYAWTVPNIGTQQALVRVFVYDDSGILGYDTSDNPFTVVPVTTGVDVETSALPKVFALHQNVPNPFNPATEIRFDMPAAGRAFLRVFGVDGRLLRHWELGALPPGRHRVHWDGRDDAGRDLGSGVYFYRLRIDGAASFEASRRMLLVK